MVSKLGSVICTHGKKRPWWGNRGDNLKPQQLEESQQGQQQEQSQQGNTNLDFNPN